jgi:hypothetical protein
VDPRKQALFNEVLKKVDPSAAPVEAPAAAAEEASPPKAKGKARK